MSTMTSYAFLISILLPLLLLLLLFGTIRSHPTISNDVILNGDNDDDGDEDGSRFGGNQTQSWWKSMSIYNVYPKSFKDSNGDGIGDLNGITQKLKHFVDLGVDVVWLNPFFESPNEDNGYDISNFVEIDPNYGTMRDFNRLIREMKKLGLKFMMDFVINHCSDQHIWFQKSKENIQPYSDYFIWANPKGYDKDGKPIPPNNWISVFRNSAWTWMESRKQFYYHAFSTHQPDLNLRNPRVVEELKNVVRFWLDKGISGMRIDAPKFFFEDKLLRDEPYVSQEAEERKSIEYNDFSHIYTTDLIECYELTRDLKDFVENEYSRKDGEERIVIVEVYSDLDKTLKWMDYVHLAFNFGFVGMPYSVNASEVDTTVTSWGNRISTYVAENHDAGRAAQKFGEEFVDIMNMLSTMLPGNLCIYYGQEIGMTSGIIRPDQIRDKNNNGITRDPLRTPMQWDDSLNAGFTSNHKSWLPVHPNYWRVNVDIDRKRSISHYHVFKSLMQLRQTPTCKYGKLLTYVLSEWVYTFTRTLPNDETYVIVLNIGSETEIVDLSVLPDMPDFLKVLISSVNAGYTPGDNISTKPRLKTLTIMRPKSGLVLTTRIDQRDSTEKPKDADKPSQPEQHSSSGVSMNNSLNTIILLICAIVNYRYL